MGIFLAFVRPVKDTTIVSLDINYSTYLLSDISENQSSPLLQYVTMDMLNFEIHCVCDFLFKIDSHLSFSETILQLIFAIVESYLIPISAIQMVPTII